MTIENQLFEDISPIINMVMLQLAMLLFVGYMILERSNSGANFVGNSYPFAGEMRQLTQENLILFLGFEYLSLWFGQISCTETITYSINNKMYMCICL